MNHIPSILSLLALKKGYESGAFTPKDVLVEIVKRRDEHHEKNIWITPLSLETMLSYLERAQKEAPLYGIPFSIKDNIDLCDVPTTAACPSYGRIPEKSAFVVEQLLKAGAIPVGKTNMDQFATGLVGTRSPYGECHHAHHPSSISGGSSSGSAVSVALGMCSFSLGTDTAGSGRVPAALHGLMGYKPTPGRLSMTGVVPACRSLDSVSIFSSEMRDLQCLYPIVSSRDVDDAYASDVSLSPLENLPIFAVIDPDSVVWKGAGDYRKHYISSIDSLRRQGYVLEEINLDVFFEVALMLYEGPWVAERYQAVGEFLEASPSDVDPTVSKIILGGSNLPAHKVFENLQLLRARKAEAERRLAPYAGLLLPTIGGWFDRQEVAADPIGVNSYLGTFTNFANLLSLSACAFPAQNPVDGAPPFGMTLFCASGSDARMLDLTSALRTALKTKPLVVCGAHLKGQPLHWQLEERGAILRASTKTAPCYKMYDIGGGKPGVIRDLSGKALEVEVYDLPLLHWGSFIDAIPSPLGVGKVELESGERVTGFLCEPEIINTAKDITEYGSWLSYLEGQMP
jgi:allophanate hydrolase